MKYSSRWILDLVYLKGAHSQKILLDVGDGDIRMYCTLADINTTINCKLFMIIYMCKTGFDIFYLSSHLLLLLLWLPSYRVSLPQKELGSEYG